MYIHIPLEIRVHICTAVVYFIMQKLFWQCLAVPTGFFNRTKMSLIFGYCTLMQLNVMAVATCHRCNDVTQS